MCLHGIYLRPKIRIWELLSRLQALDSHQNYKVMFLMEL